MNKKQLWDSLLQQAISGKLVPQLDTEPAVEQIGPDPAPDEVPFELPEKWKWVNLDRTGSFSSGYTPSQEQILGQGDIPFFKVAQMNLKGNEKYLRLTPTFLNTPRKIFEAGTIVFPKLGGAILTNKRRILAQKSVVDTNTAGFLPTKDVLSLEYAYAFLSTLDFGQYARGTAVPALDLSKVKKIWLPLPPLAEQRRIVAKLEELKPLVDQFGEAHDKLSELEADFPRKLKASILQAAMQGKLVPQLDGEPAVEQIGATPAIEDAPFAIPEKWKWVQIGNLLPFGKNATQVDPSKIPSNAWVLGLEDIESNGGLISKNRNAQVSSAKNAFNAGNVLYSKMRPYLNKAIIADEDGYCTTEIFVLDVNKAITPVDAKYLLYFLRSKYFVSYATTCSKGQKPRLDTKLGQKALFPLPPIEEQKRIVERIEAIFAEADKLLALKEPSL